MRVNARTLARKCQSWWQGLQPRERLIVGAAGGGLALLALWMPIVWFDELLAQNESMLTFRAGQAEQMEQRLQRYHQLQERFAKVQSTYSQSQMTFEQVTVELDKIVRQTVGNDNYDLKKSREPEPIGDDFQKQDFTLRVRALTLQQLVKLLYEIEQGPRPLFLGKIDIQKTPRSDQFSATMEVFSIGKARAI